ncbi:MAG: sensor histidine kinase [Chloroflexi bacterium]|nr:sensor histidine kinase [Chloroflexota bacterium]
MTFKVAARTLLHLGAELISSDAVALQELIKNAFDAGSKRATVDVVVRVFYATVGELAEQLRQEEEHGRNGHDGAASSAALPHLRRALQDAVDPTAPGAKALVRQAVEAADWATLRDALTEANYLVVADMGEGMSLENLRGAFLTIGTRSRHAARLQQRSDGPLARGQRPILGEKGVGRLSAMRLGTRLHVESSKAGESHWNVLDINWSVFSHESDALLDEFHVAPRRGAPKERPQESGTRIRISGLTSEWTRERLDELAKYEFSKLTDPFTETPVFPIQLRYNGEPVSIPRFNRLLLENAHATVRASFEEAPPADAAGDGVGGMRVTGTIRYRSRERVFALDGTHLASVAGSPPRVLRSLGPFDIEIYWYNRRILTALEGIGDRRLVLRLVNEWGGGLMVFRDGFRVLPYGGPEDDWLGLDRIALGSPGYKVNRTQLIGRVSISSVRNPALTDQTNREGLRDSDEKRALIQLLRYVIQTEFRTFLNQTDAADRPREPVPVEELGGRVEEEEQEIRKNLAQLVQRVPALHEQQPLLEAISGAVDRLHALMDEVRELASQYEAGRGQLLNLAGIGLTVEMLAHELNRATEHALHTLAEAPGVGLPRQVEALVRTLETQLKTLQKRLRILDPLSTTGRQRKELFDVVELVRDTIEAHRDRFEREHIDVRLVVEPHTSRPRLPIRAVKGMVVQILENLIANSVYWLRQQRTLDPSHPSWIRIVVDTEAKTLSVTDNGPGVAPEFKGRIFEAFFTTKPAGMGKGLGLFIAREIAKYHGVELFLAEPPTGPQGTYHTFVLTLEGMK